MTGTISRQSYSAIFLCLFSTVLYAEKVLIYDPEKGIIFVEKESGVKKNKTPSSASQKKPKTDIHLGRKKDPPDLYFKSGLEYFKNSDFKNALKNFTYADSVDPHPEYMLWKAKSLRQMGDFDKMLYLMQQLIENYPESDVADDALFELALHYQKIDDYHRAGLIYSQLTEQYPFGLLFSTGEELREIAREQKKLMRAELINLLSILGFSGDDLNTSVGNFQKGNYLEITGNADQKTVQLIKHKHKQFLINEEQQIEEKLYLQKLRFLLLIAGAVSIVTLLILIILRSRINSRKQHLSELQKILTDLDVGKL